MLSAVVSRTNVTSMNYFSGWRGTCVLANGHFIPQLCNTPYNSFIISSKEHNLLRSRLPSGDDRRVDIPLHKNFLWSSMVPLTSVFFKYYDGQRHPVVQSLRTIVSVIDLILATSRLFVRLFEPQEAPKFTSWPDKTSTPSFGQLLLNNIALRVGLSRKNNLTRPGRWPLIESGLRHGTAKTAKAVNTKDARGALPRPTASHKSLKCSLEEAGVILCVLIGL